MKEVVVWFIAKKNKIFFLFLHVLYFEFKTSLYLNLDESWKFALILSKDQYQYMGYCPPTPPLTQH